jgi:hypothetical protein
MLAGILNDTDQERAMRVCVAAVAMLPLLLAEGASAQTVTVPGGSCPSGYRATAYLINRAGQHFVTCQIVKAPPPAAINTDQSGRTFQER